MPGRPDREANRNGLSRHESRRHRRGARPDRQIRSRRQAPVGRPARKRGGNPAGTREARRPARCRHRPDVGTRPGQRLPAHRLDRQGVVRAPRVGPRCRGCGRVQVDGRTRPRHAGVSRGRGAHLRLRQQHPPGRAGRGCRQCLRLPGLRPGLRPAAVLPRHRAVPLGGAVRRPRGHLPHGCQGQGADPGRRAPAPVAGRGRRADTVPGVAGAHLLGRSRRARPPRPGVQRDGPQRRTQGAGRHRPRPSRQRIRGEPES